MKHTIEFKLPKIFGKKTEQELEGETEFVLKNRDISRMVSIGIPVAVAFTAGYLIGFNRGVNKNSTMYIIK